MEFLKQSPKVVLLGSPVLAKPKAPSGTQKANAARANKPRMSSQLELPSTSEAGAVVPEVGDEAVGAELQARRPKRTNDHLPSIII